MTATITKHGFLDMQVCVPKDWGDEEVIAFAEQGYPCGTSLGWQIRREGSPLLSGDPERQSCDTLEDHVHIMLDA